MKTNLLKHLATIAPSISIRTLWTPDSDSGPISKESADDDNWTAWQAEIRATAIINGEEIAGNSYLGGTVERAGDLPECSNPEISGYESNMTTEALTKLLVKIETTPGCGDYDARDIVIGQIGDTLRYLGLN